MDYIIKQTILEIERFNDSIKDALDSKNISNTREAANSLRVEFGENFVNSIGIFYLEFLDTGRGPGRMPPIAPLIRWAENKFNVDFDEAKSIAFAVAKKIASIGTEIFNNHSLGIELDKKILTLKENLSENIQLATKLEIIQGMDKFKKIYNMSL